MVKLKLLQLHRCIARNNYNISGEQQILDFTVNTNVDFEINISSEWIQEYTQESSRSLTERHLSLLIDANPSTTERSATISLNYNDLKQTILINQVARTDKMKISIIHSETEFLSPEFQGNNISGIVTWGDGAQSELGNSHYFNNSYPKTSTFETVGVNKFKIKNLNSITSITIYCNEDKNGTAEDFEIIDTNWD